MKAREAPLISVRGLGRRFGTRWVVRDLSFVLMLGVILGLLAPMAAGRPRRSGCSRA